MMVQEQMTHGLAIGEGLVFSLVGEDLNSVYIEQGGQGSALDVTSVA